MKIGPASSSSWSSSWSHCYHHLTFLISCFLTVHSFGFHHPRSSIVARHCRHPRHCRHQDDHHGILRALPTLHHDHHPSPHRHRHRHYHQYHHQGGMGGNPLRRSSRRREAAAASLCRSSSPLRRSASYQNDPDSLNKTNKTKMKKDDDDDNNKNNNKKNNKKNKDDTTTTTTTTTTTKDDRPTNESEGGGRNSLVLMMRRFVTRLTLVLTSIRNKLWSSVQVQFGFVRKFRSLSRTTKMILLMQMLFVAFLGGSVIRSIAHRRPRAAMPPVEIPYSHFMDMIEHSSTPYTGRIAERLPRIFNVRIGPERIGFHMVTAHTAEQRHLLKTMLDASSSATATAAATTAAGQASTASAALAALARSGTTTTTTAAAAAAGGAALTLPIRAAYTRRIQASSDFISFLRHHHAPFTAAAKTTSPREMMSLFTGTFVLIFYFAMIQRLSKAFKGGGIDGSDGPGGGPGKLLSNPQDLPMASFDDIEGVDDAKLEVMEFVDALNHPDKYALLGARVPKGLLLEGPPGTGKTLLARATAATAGVPLLYCSGSDFVEIFVGRGAARVRSTFEKASTLAPCIVFIDELDALGKSRDGNGPWKGGGFGGGTSDESEQTLNQLLTSMDGLVSNNQRIVVLAATNRREVLDPALVRPGRFDRIVRLELPDVRGRERILRVHARKLPGFQEVVENGGDDDDNVASSSSHRTKTTTTTTRGSGRLGGITNAEGAASASSGGYVSSPFGIGNRVDLSAVAAATPGCSGAELEFIVNEAAIRAVRRVSSAIRNGVLKDSDIVPNVTPPDFERSVANFYRTRRSGGVGGGVGGVGGLLNRLRN